MRTSYTALQTFGQCPQKYKFQEIDKLPAKKSKEAIFGTLVHGALEYMYSNDPVFPTLDEILSRFQEKLRSATFPKDELPRFEKLGMQLLTKFYKINPPWNANAIGLETFFEIEISPTNNTAEEPHRITGKIDRMDKLTDGRVEIIDYKTSRRLPSQAEVDADLQLAIYQQAALKRWPNLKPKDVLLSLYFLRANEKLSTTKDAAATKQLEAHILERISEIEKARETNQFPPKPSALCEWCSYKPHCPAWRHLYKTTTEKEAPSEKEIAALSDEFITLKAKQDEIKKRIAELSKEIHSYLDKADLSRLFFESGTIARQSQQRTSWDMEKVVQIFKEINQLESILSPDEKVFKKLLASLPKNIQEKLERDAKQTKEIQTLKVTKGS